MVHGWLAPTRGATALFRRAETVGGCAALPRRGGRSRLVAVASAASSGRVGTATADTLLGSHGSAATALDYRLAGGDDGRDIAPTIESTVERVTTCACSLLVVR